MNIAAIIIIIYFIMILAIGLMWPRKRHDQSLDDFHLAGRSLKGILLVGTFCATIISASATLGMAGLGYSKGLPGAWWMLSGTIGLMVLSGVLCPKSESFRMPYAAGFSWPLL